MRQRELVVLVAVVVLSLISVPGHADTFGVPIPYATIQAGIDAASEGDTVLVAPGTYTGTGSGDRMNLHGVDMVVMSEMGALDTIVDCEGVGRGFRASSGEDSTSVIRGFTFAIRRMISVSITLVNIPASCCEASRDSPRLHGIEKKLKCAWIASG